MNIRFARCSRKANETCALALEITHSNNNVDMATDSHTDTATTMTNPRIDSSRPNILATTARIFAWQLVGGGIVFLALLMSNELFIIVAPIVGLVLPFLIVRTILNEVKRMIDMSSVR